MQDELDCQLRAMGPGDLGAVLAVQAACYPPSMQEPATVLLARMRSAPDSCVVAVDGQGICAYLFAYPSRIGAVTPLDAPFAPAPDADTLYLHDLAVALRAHGRGLARRLVAQVLEHGRARGLAASSLVSVQDTAAFWSALGYRETALACPEARAALAGYPGGARYMVRVRD